MTCAANNLACEGPMHSKTAWWPVVVQFQGHLLPRLNVKHTSTGNRKAASYFRALLQKVPGFGRIELT